MKKRLLFSLFLFSVLFMTLVSAAPYIDLRQGANQLIQWIVDIFEPFLQVLLGPGYYTGEFLFMKFLIFILIFSIIYLVVSKIPLFEENTASIWIISIVVPLLAIRYLDPAWLNTILIQYQVVAVALGGILPFIIYLFFLHNVSESHVVRKIGWILFIVVYFGLWSTANYSNYSQIYLWTMIVALVFLFLDGTIHRAFLRQKMKEGERGPVVSRIASIDSELGSIRGSGLPEKIKKKQEKRLLKERKRLEKLLS